jgi:valyl-tRNA synthetase
MTELSKAYSPKDVEDRLYEWWDKNGYFAPEGQTYLDPHEKPFVITIPPPNVTGTLHMGHALVSAIEDLMTRYHRMKGARTLWVPGTDHAGIATQSVVEKKLAQEGKNRRDMSRSDFLEEVWNWKDYSHKIITKQQKALGISVDWSREAFTMDDKLSHAVRTAFKMLYDKGLIYRDTRMINWDPVQLTGVSDLEVETEEEGEPGKLWFVRYPLQTNRWEGPRHEWGSGRWAEGATQWITVATTRPETILGDTAVMVNPDDDRYRDLIACRAILPALGRWVPIIGDAAVDTNFGTGAVKVTPAHDFTDYEVGKRHHLAFIEVMDQHARMNVEAGPYEGLDRFECRKRMVADLEKEGLLVKVDDYMVRLGRGQRSGAVIEPRISLQWFCNMKSMAAAAMASVREGRIRIVPERFDKIWFNWLENIRDWNISRQLWWGHQIPVWYVQNPEAQTTSAAQAPKQYCELTEAEAYAKAIKEWGPEVVLEQDHDVLDTWFSSGLWPFSTLGWPNDTSDMRAYYPTTHLETGYDILFFWVARMVMLGLELTGKEPFNTVYLHGLIRTADGKKMSKSRPDRIIDPLELIDTYGTDAVRFFLVTAGSPGNDIKIDARKGADGKWQSERIEGARNFANKLWNVTRFVLGKLSPESRVPSSETGSELADRWITARTARVVADVRKLMDDYQYGEAGKIIYDFIWNDFCDWYVELSKLSLNAGVLVRTLDTALRLLHPFMPYVTEELWQKLKEVAGTSEFRVPSFESAALILAPFPAADQTSIGNGQSSIDDMSALQDVIRAIRNARSEYKVESNKRIPVLVQAGSRAAMLNENRAAIESLARVEGLTIAEALPAPEQSMTYALGEITVYLPMAGLVDLEAEKKRLADELAAIEGQITKSGALLASDFTKRAPAQVIEKEKAKLAEAQAKREQLKERLAAM